MRKAIEPVHFIVYGDSCSGIPGTAEAANLARIQEQILRLEPRPPLLVFMGDHIAGYADPEELRRQWRHFFAEEFAAIAAAFPANYHITSNHSLFDAASVDVWREVFSTLPKNGPSGQERLAYWVRDGDLLLVFTNTLGADPTGEAQLEWDWLNGVLDANRDASVKLVFGHHPIHPVNGYARFPMWRADPAEGKPFWDVLVRHGVLAYFCSHIIAFDVQVHRDVLQICTAGAGTRYGPGGAMPGASEYLHFVEAWATPESVAVVTRDDGGRRREAMRWPIELPASVDWIALVSGENPLGLGLAIGGRLGDEVGEGFAAWSVRGLTAEQPTAADQVILCGWSASDAAPRIEVRLAAGTGRLVLSLVIEPGRHPVLWTGPRLPDDRPFDLVVAIEPGMGPGGCLVRTDETQSWSSMESESAEGAAGLLWPDHWSIGHGASGMRDRPFRGPHLSVAGTIAFAPKQEADAIPS